MTKINQLCVEKSITIYALEKAADLSHGTIAKWHNRKPKAESVLKVAKCLGVSMEDLIDGG